MLKKCILGALGKQMSVHSCKSPFEHFGSRDVGSFYLLGGGGGAEQFPSGRLLFEILKCLNIFNFN